MGRWSHDRRRQRCCARRPTRGGIVFFPVSVSAYMGPKSDFAAPADACANAPFQCCQSDVSLRLSPSPLPFARGNTCAHRFSALLQSGAHRSRNATTQVPVSWRNQLLFARAHSLSDIQSDSTKPASLSPRCQRSCDGLLFRLCDVDLPLRIEHLLIASTNADHDLLIHRLGGRNALPEQSAR